MRKLLLLCAMLLSGIGAWAQITDVALLSNTKCYHITSKDAARGAFYAASGATHLSHCGGTHDNYLNKDVQKDKTSPAQQFALIQSPTHSDRYYIYSVSENDFANWDGQSGQGVHSFVKLEPTPSCYMTITKNGDYFNIKINGEKKLNFSGGYSYGVFANYETDDNGNNLVITEAADFDPTIALARIKMYEGIFPVTGLGYPKETSSAYTGLLAAINGTNIAAYNSALTAYYASTDVEKPENGKAYTISAWWRNETRPFTFFMSTDEYFTGQTPAYAPKANAEASVFVCRKLENIDGEDDAYVFVTNNGYYLDWQTDDKNETAKVYRDEFRFKIEKALLSTNGDGPVTTNEEMLGKFMLRGYQTDVNNVSASWHYMMYSQATKHFHNGTVNQRWYADNAHTVYYVIEEVPEYTSNTVRLSEAAALADGETCVATYYAPYATVLPEDYSAYKATTVNENYVSLEEVGTEIPANTGVIVMGPASDKVVLSLSVSNPVALDGNLLEGSATDTYVQGSAYVLSAPGGEVGLYKAALNKDANGNAGNTHFKNNAGKAYLPARAVVSESRFLVFDFGGEETGITETENGNVNAENDEVYDLAGRRVQNAQKGIFIVNGKMVVR